MRTRDLGIRIGRGKPGRLNAITDVAGVRVGHHTVHVEAGDASAHTGVTVIEPRARARATSRASRAFTCSTATATRPGSNGFARRGC
ncbi:hypothetical protein NCM_01882 [Burkholderia pseudomallei]